jgi:hypothetical protein
MDSMCPPPAPRGLQAKGDDLYSWAESLDASAAKCRRIVGLTNVRWLCALPLLRNMHRVPGIIEARWHRYLFQRHVKDILYWSMRLKKGDPAGFFNTVNWLIWNKFFPDRDSDCNGEIREEARQAMPTRSPTGTPSAQAHSRRRLNVVSPATRAQQAEESRISVAMRLPAMATVMLVPVLGDAPPFLSQEECFRSPSDGRENVRGLHQHVCQREHRRNLALSPRAQRGDPHGAHRHDENRGGGDDIPVAEVAMGLALGPQSAVTSRGGRRGQRSAARRTTAVREGGRARIGRSVGHAPPGWTTPTILSHQLSPIALRAQREVQELRDPGGAVSLDSETPWDDVHNDNTKEGFVIPIHTPLQGRRQPSPPLASADTTSRQSLGEHYPSLHNCGVYFLPSRQLFISFF